MKKQDWFLGIGGMTLFVVALLFKYSGVLPSMNIAESGFLIVVIFLFALYRPVWAFVMLLILLPLETFSLLPESFGVRLRPYQVLTGCLYGALFVRWLSGRLPVGWFRLVWADWLMIVFGLGSIVSAFTSVTLSASLKQVFIVWSFLLLYFLTRYFLRSERDICRIVPFTFLSALGVSGFALWQSVRGLLGMENFTAMAGRPNSTLTEADWLGLFGVVILTAVLVVIGKKSAKKFTDGNFQYQMILGWFGWWLALIGAVILLTVTVTRSAWVASLVVAILFTMWIVARCYRAQETWVTGISKLCGVLLTMVISIAIGSQLTAFSLGQRAVSTGGWQSITIACEMPNAILPPPRIQSADELMQYSCRHINLEDIDAEKAAGNFVMSVERPDPNVATRSNIYSQVRGVLQTHPIFGIGWGSIGDILGRDASGNALNASNIFLEVWLGAGILGALAFGLVWFGIGILAMWNVWQDIFSGKFLNIPPALLRPFPIATVLSSILSVFILFSWFGITVFNLFNSGILLGFIWVWLAVAVSVVTRKSETVN
ncbi:MAG: O-antigen ligase family protein [Candidatus Moraniibacteriota bacterium]